MDCLWKRALCLAVAAGAAGLAGRMKWGTSGMVGGGVVGGVVGWLLCPCDASGGDGSTAVPEGLLLTAVSPKMPMLTAQQVVMPTMTSTMPATSSWQDLVGGATSCPTGAVWSGGRCVCPAGTRWDPYANKCAMAVL
jgi:hypothetical protein